MEPTLFVSAGPKVEDMCPYNILQPAEKCSYRSIKKGNMFKAKTLIEKGGTRNLNQLP